MPELKTRIEEFLLERRNKGKILGTPPDQIAASLTAVPAPEGDVHMDVPL